MQDAPGEGGVGASLTCPAQEPFGSSHHHEHGATRTTATTMTMEHLEAKKTEAENAKDQAETTDTKSMNEPMKIEEVVQVPSGPAMAQVPAGRASNSYCLSEAAAGRAPAGD